MNKLTLTSALLWLIAGAAVSAHSPVHSGYAMSQLNAATSYGACSLSGNNGDTNHLDPAKKNDVPPTDKAPGISVLLKCLGTAATDIRLTYSPATVHPDLPTLASTSNNTDAAAVKLGYDKVGTLTDVGLAQPVLITALTDGTKAGDTDLPLNVYATYVATDLDANPATLPFEIEYK